MRQSGVGKRARKGQRLRAGPGSAQVTTMGHAVHSVWDPHDEAGGLPTNMGLPKPLLGCYCPAPVVCPKCRLRQPMVRVVPGKGTCL